MCHVSLLRYGGEVSITDLIDGGEPAGIKIVPSFGCRKNRMTIKIITRSGKNMTTPRGIDIVFSCIRRRRKDKRGKNLVAPRCVSSMIGRVDFCILVDRRSMKPGIAATDGGRRGEMRERKSITGRGPPARQCPDSACRNLR